MQPVLLMKQTLDATYDPGALLLDGPHAHFTAVDQLLARFGGKNASGFSVVIRMYKEEMAEVQFQKHPGGGIDVVSTTETNPAGGGQRLDLRGVASHDGRHHIVTPVIRQRCFLRHKPEGLSSKEAMHDESAWDPLTIIRVRRFIRSIVHVPAPRGNPERTYKTTAVGDEFAGTFDPYVASIIHHWQATKDIRIKQLGAALQKLGLNWTIDASRVDDTRVELRVGRLKKKTTGGARDMVSIADVGFGVRQCLPVLVALLAARPGQLVYIEEPEIHLHPRAQVALAQILADAANRGVRVVVETHSSLLLLGVQALVAEGALPPEQVALHWFSLTEDGATEVRSADLDEAGAFGDWPEDFAEVTLDAQARYLDAAEKRLARAKR